MPRSADDPFGRGFAAALGATDTPPRPRRPVHPVYVLALVCFLIGAALIFAPAGDAAEDDRCPASASICTYRLPDSVQAARDACYRAEATERGIPSGREAYTAWWSSASPSTRAEWTAAFRACRDHHQLPGGTWAWHQMVYVGSTP